MGERRRGGGEHVAVYRRFLERFAGRRARRFAAGPEGDDAPFAPGRDPRSAQRVLEDLVRARGWSSAVARSELFVAWADAVGPVTAEHSTPVEIRDGTLLVRCDSTAWATQLGLMRGSILTAIAERFPDAGVVAVRFVGPDVPSFKRGLRSVPGRGPRDTYG